MHILYCCVLISPSNANMSKDRPIKALMTQITNIHKPWVSGNVSRSPPLNDTRYEQQIGFPEIDIKLGKQCRDLSPVVRLVVVHV